MKPGRRGKEKNEIPKPAKKSKPAPPGPDPPDGDDDDEDGDGGDGGGDDYEYFSEYSYEEDEESEEEEQFEADPPVEPSVYTDDSRGPRQYRRNPHPLVRQVLRQAEPHPIGPPQTGPPLQRAPTGPAQMPRLLAQVNCGPC